MDILHLKFKNAPGTKTLFINLTRDKICDFISAPVCLVYRTVNSFIWRSVWLSATGFRFNSKLTPDVLPYVTFNWKKTFLVYIFLRIIKLVITLLSIFFRLKFRIVIIVKNKEYLLQRNKLKKVSNLRIWTKVFVYVFEVERLLLIVPYLLTKCKHVSLLYWILTNTT